MIPTRALLFALILLGGLAAPASAQQVTVSTSIWLPAAGATGLSTLSGTLDQPTGIGATQLSGWVVDTTAQGWNGIDEVQIWNGLMDAGGQQVAEAVIHLDRPDVADALNNPFWEASGYSADVRLNALESASILYVYAHTPSKGWWFQEGFLTTPIGGLAQGARVDIEVPTPLGTVHAATPFTIKGTAYDPSASPDQGIGVDRVSVYLNGDRKSGIFIGDAKLGYFDKFTAALNTQFANAGWQLTFQPSSWFDTTTMADNQLTPLTVYAHSSVTGQETEADTTMVISIP